MRVVALPRLQQLFSWMPAQHEASPPQLLVRRAQISAAKVKPIVADRAVTIVKNCIF